MMGKLFGSIIFFLVAIFLAYLLNLPAADFYASSHYSDFAAPYVIAVLELLHHPFEHSFVIVSWLIAGFLCGIITRSLKGAIAVSIITGFILSLTWIFFMWKYTAYWGTFTTSNSTIEFLGQTLGVGLLLGLFSSAPALCGAYLTSPRKKDKIEVPIKEIQTTCPNCGATFQSKPKYCYRCNTLLSEKEN